MIEESIYIKINDFIKDIENIKWFENAGKKSDKYTVVQSDIKYPLPEGGLKLFEPANGH